MMDTLNDREFLDDAKKVEIDIEPSDATATEALVEKLFATPSSVVARDQAAMPQSQ